MSLSRRYGIINIAYHGSFHDGKELYTMSNVKRKDSKNRNLRNGESQRKDGRPVTVMMLLFVVLLLIWEIQSHCM